MGKIRCNLTVYFEEPFWVGVFDVIENRKISAARVVFGAEPKDYELFEYILRYYTGLHFSPAVDTVVKISRETPKGFSAKHVNRLRQPVSVPSRSRLSNCNRSRTNKNVRSEAVNRNWPLRNVSLN